MASHVGTKNLIPFKSVEEAKAKGKRGGIQSGISKRQKKTIREIYAEFLVKNHKVKIGKKDVEMTPQEIIEAAVMKTLNSGRSSTVAMLKEMADRTEGAVGSSEAAKKDLDVLGGLMGTANNEEKTEAGE